MTHSSRTGINYWTRVKEGNCGKCGRPRGTKGTTRLCEEHARKAAKKQDERRDLLRAKGKCPTCAEKLQPGEKACRVHKLKDAVNSANYRERVRRRVM